MTNKLAIWIAGVTLFVTTAPVWAHHSFAAEFDANRPVKLRGTVTEMEWINPHSWIHVDVKGPGGKVVSWMVEAGSQNALLRRGFTKSALPPGTEILIEVHQAKDGSNRANGRTETFAHAMTLFLGSAGTGAPAEK